MHHIVPQEHGGEHSRRNCVCLCSTCHRKLHDGLLRIEGDADGDLTFFDAYGALLSASPTDEATHVGSSGLSPEADRVLRLMGERGGWHADMLCEATGFTVAQVACATLELELAGQVRSTLSGFQRCG